MIFIRERTTMKTLIEEFDIKAIDPTVIELEKRLIDHESGHVMKTVGHLMTIDIQITGNNPKIINAFELRYIFSKRNRGNRNRRDRSGENRDRGTSGRGKKPGSTAARSWQHDDRTRTTY